MSEQPDGIIKLGTGFFAEGEPEPDPTETPEMRAFTMSKKLPDSYEVQTSYPFTCAACGREQMARPSIAMHGFRLNTGHGKCMECGTFLHLKIDTEKQTMISQDWNEWLAAETAANEEPS